MKDRTVPMRISFDRSADAAYFYLDEKIESGGVARTVLVDPTEIGGMVNIDLDDRGRLLGIEIMGATGMLPAGLIARIME